MQNQFDQRQQSIQRRLAQAQVMRDQEFNPAQGQISGGVYIRPDFSQSLAQGLRMYGGMKESQKAEQDLQALQTERAGANQSAMANALRMMGGAPADVPYNTKGHEAFRPPTTITRANPKGALVPNPPVISRVKP